MKHIIIAVRKKWSSALVGGFVFLPWNLLMLLLIFFCSKVFPQSRVDWPLVVKVEKSYAVVRVGVGSDVTVFREVFSDRCYDLSLPKNPQGIIDIGANVGYSTVWFALRYPQVRIWAYEPDPANLARLHRNVRRFAQVAVCSEAISGASGIRTLHSVSGRGMSSSLYPRPGLEPIQVLTVSFDEALARAGGRVGIVKFDIEGAEYEAFHASKELSRVSAFVGEVHPDLLPVSVNDFEESFEGYVLTRVPTEGRRYILLARQ